MVLALATGKTTPRRWPRRSTRRPTLSAGGSPATRASASGAYRASSPRPHHDRSRARIAASTCGRIALRAALGVAIPAGSRFVVHLGRFEIRNLSPRKAPVPSPVREVVARPAVPQRFRRPGAGAAGASRAGSAGARVAVNTFLHAGHFARLPTALSGTFNCCPHCSQVTVTDMSSPPGDVGAARSDAFRTAIGRSGNVRTSGSAVNRFLGVTPPTTAHE